MTPSSPNTAQTTPRQDAVEAILDRVSAENIRYMVRVGGLSPWVTKFKADLRAALSPAPEAGEEGEMFSVPRDAKTMVQVAALIAARDGRAVADVMIEAKAALSSTRSAGGEVEPVAWRWHWNGGDEPDVWAYREDRIASDEHRTVQPLYASHQPARMPTREQLIRLRDWIAREVPIGTESATYWLTELDRALFHTGETKGDGRG